MALVATIGVLLLAAVLLMYNSFSWGLVVYKFYYWFLLPVFTGLPIINYWQAVGLVFILGLFQTHIVYSIAIKEEYKDKNSMILGSLIGPWLTLFIGYLFHVIFIG